MKHQPTVPTPPDAWLLLGEYRYKDGEQAGQIVGKPISFGAFASPDDPELQACAKKHRGDWGTFRIAQDHPSLEILHYDLVIRSAPCLTARDIWFKRHEFVLEPHLRDPRIAQVFTFAQGALTDPLTSHKSSAGGPFAFPRGKPWPVCGFCSSRLAFLGALDFRQHDTVPVPHGSLVLHICNECGVTPDRETWSITWLTEHDDIDIRGDRDQELQVGTRWHATDWPTLAFRAEELTDNGPFLQEDSIFLNFTCFADKVGGHNFWIQGDRTPVDSNGQPMTYIGQMIGSRDIEIGDMGIAYLFFSPITGETVMEVQYF
jgi:hypothetical protein